MLASSLWQGAYLQEKLRSSCSSHVRARAGIVPEGGPCEVVWQL